MENNQPEPIIHSPLPAPSAGPVEVRTRQLWFPDYPCPPEGTRALRDRICAGMRAAKKPYALFHNHTEARGHRYTYPLLQYRSLPHKGRAVAGLWVLGREGGEALEAFTEVLWMPEVVRATRLSDCLSYSSTTHTTRIEITPTFQRYRVQQLALNERQAAQWAADPSRRHQDALLEAALRFALFGFLNAVGYRVPDRQLTARIVDVPRGTWYLAPPLAAPDEGTPKGRVLVLDVEFDLNLSLPDGLGLGAHKAFGWGVLHKLS